MPRTRPFTDPISFHKPTSRFYVTRGVTCDSRSGFLPRPVGRVPTKDMLAATPHRVYLSPRKPGDDHKKSTRA